MYHLHMICPFQHLLSLVDAFHACFAEVTTVEVLDYGPCRKSLATEEALHGFLVVECLQEMDEDLLFLLANDRRILSLSEYSILSSASNHPLAPQHEVNNCPYPDLSPKGCF